jgi:hypothetical protein
MKTTFMYLFDLPEIELIKTEPRCIISTNEYVDMCVNMNIKGLINIPHVTLDNGRKEGINFNFNSDYAEIKLYAYGFNNYLWAMIKPEHLVYYDLNKICKHIDTVYYFTWDKYRNKKGVITEIGKLKFLNDILKHKTHATSKR